MVKLDNIGFYTLTDERAANYPTDLQRCELLITDRCNFKCSYCRPQRTKGNIPLAQATRIIDLWAEHNLKNIRFSGGEPTLHPQLNDMITHAKRQGVERVALSTNGSAPLSVYHNLVALGVDDFSISLDACCASIAEKMSGCDLWKRVTDNIAALSRCTYVTAGVVLSTDNIHDAANIIRFAHELGVADIRIITEAESRPNLPLPDIPQHILNAHPILNYRIRNLTNGRPMRGLPPNAPTQCGLVLDDMAIAGDKHYPCIIYLREGGDPIGEVSASMRYKRREWHRTHDVTQDPICKRNCLDVCLDFNRKRCARSRTS